MKSRPWNARYVREYITHSTSYWTHKHVFGTAKNYVKNPINFLILQTCLATPAFLTPPDDLSIGFQCEIPHTPFSMAVCFLSRNACCVSTSSFQYKVLLQRVINSRPFKGKRASIFKVLEVLLTLQEEEANALYLTECSRLAQCGYSPLTFTKTVGRKHTDPAKRI
jgi:hypothetical protein